MGCDSGRTNASVDPTGSVRAAVGAPTEPSLFGRITDRSARGWSPGWHDDFEQAGPVGREQPPQDN